MPATFETTSFTPSELILGGEITSRQVTVSSGSGAVATGTVLGKIGIGAATSAAKAGNTGNGTLTMNAAAPILAHAQVGVYVARCTTAATNGGTFRVSDPNGNILGDVAVGTAFAKQIGFAIADGATDFVVGDEFNITVAEGSGEYVVSKAAAIDGSQTPDCILAEDVDATAADVTVPAYFTGQFNAGALTIGAGHTVASIREALRAKGVHLISTQTTY
jgi:hypothetical protein